MDATASDRTQRDATLGRAQRPWEALRALHHAMARQAATGASEAALAALASDATGRPWTQAATSALAASPAFRELVAFYRAG